MQNLVLRKTPPARRFRDDDKHDLPAAGCWPPLATRCDVLRCAALHVMGMGTGVRELTRSWDQDGKCTRIA